MGQASKISAFVVCCNEERNIGRCLESLRWCDEIVIVDSGSSDGTLEICAKYTNRIFKRPWPGFVEQKRFALAQCRYEWVLNIDADEEVSPELRAEIQGVLSSDAAHSGPINGYYLSRVVFYLGRWWRRGGWYPEYRLRLCRKDKTSWGGEDPHEKALVTGGTAKLKGELFHYTYDSIQDQINSLNAHSQAAALSMYKNGVRAGLYDLLLRPLARFVKFYILRRGFLEARAGMVVAILEAWYVFLKYAKLWELGGRGVNK